MKLNRLVHPLRRLHCYFSSTGGLFRDTLSYYRHPVTGVDLYLVGTNHASAKSAEEVRDVIRLVRPKSLMIELCEKRRLKIEHGEDTAVFINRLGPLFQSHADVINQFLRSLGIEPGLEFKVAMQEAKDLNINLILGDQDIATTLRELSNAVKSAGLPKLFQFLSKIGNNVTPLDKKSVPEQLKDHIESMKHRSFVRETLKEAEKYQPQAVQALLHDRDDYMYRKLLKAPGDILVGVVGLAHMDGIERRWNDVHLYHTNK